MSVFLDKNKFLNIFKNTIPLIGIILLILIIWNIGLSKIIDTFLKIHPMLIFFSALLTIPRILIRNQQWQLILKNQKIKITYLKSLKIYLIGYFYATITPGYLGTIIKAPYVKDETDEPIGKIFSNFFILSFINTFPLYIFAFFGSIVLINYNVNIFYITISVLIFVILFYGFFIKKERGEMFFLFLYKILFLKKLKKIYNKFTITFYDDFPEIKKLITPFFLSVICWIIIYSQIYLLGLSLNIEIPYIDFLLIYPIANLVALIPITAGGLGTREATLIFLFSFYGVSPEIAVVLSLSGHLITDVLTGLYGLIISFSDLRIKKIFFPSKNSKIIDDER